MKKRSKLITLSLVFILAAALFTGCGGSGSAVDNELKELGLADAKDLKEVTLTFYLPGEEKPDAKKVLKEIEREAKDSLNIRLNFKWMSYWSLRSEVKSALNSNDTFEGFYFTPSDYIVELNSGKIKDLSRLLPEYAPSLYKSFSKEDIEASKIDGKIVAIPKGTQLPGIQAVTVREDLRKKFNIPEIRSLEDYEVFLSTIKSNEKGMTPGNALFYGSMNVLARAFGYTVLDDSLMLVYRKDDPSMKVLPWEKAPEFRDFVSRMSRWREKGYIASVSEEDIYNNNRSNEIVKELTSGKLASSVQYYGFCRRLNAELITTGHSGWEFKDYILYPDRNLQKPSPIEGAIAFNANGANVERALMFLNWIQSGRENYELFMYGVKDGKYIFDEDGVQSWGPGSKIDSYANWQGNEAFCNFNYEMRNYRPTDEIGKVSMELMNKMEYPPHLGFSPNYSPIAEDVQARANEFGSDIEWPLMTGELNPGNLADGIEYLRMVGTEKIVLEIQNQLDKWISEK